MASSGTARREGVVADWDDERGFGSITPTGSGFRTFVHISASPRGGRAPGPRRPGLASALAVAGVYLLAVMVVALAGDAPLWMPAAYVSLSLATLLVYRSDKAAAEAGRWRTSEGTLHLLALAGGWPGALVARHLYRHKTSKQPFVTEFWLTVVTNCLALVWLAMGIPPAIV